MTSFRQAEANRRNALGSTGPRTEDGKRRSRRNALRHGLCAETVIEILEDVDDYQRFEAAVIADYDARTAVERELVLRLASLLWRIRRATSIETDLLRIQAEIVSERTPAANKPPQRPAGMLVSRIGTADLRIYAANDQASARHDENSGSSEMIGAISDGQRFRVLTHSFIRLNNFDNGVFERLGRYEAGLWRQMLQTLLALHPIKRRDLLHRDPPI